MPFVLNTNVTAILAQTRLGRNAEAVAGSLEKLASGFRINRAADDAAGLAISENLTSQIVTRNRALQNAQDGISVLDVAEGGLGVINENLQRIRELAVQGANDTYSQTERDALAKEIRSRVEDIQRIADSTQFNTINILDGSAANALLQVGVNSNPVTNTLDITSALASAQPDDLGILNGVPVNTLDDIYNLGTQTSGTLTSAAAFRNYITQVDTALARLHNQQSTIGSFQNQLESVITSLELATETFSASRSRLRDLDVAEESSNLVRNQILEQAATTVLAQSNRFSELTLQLLQR